MKVIALITLLFVLFSVPVYCQTYVPGYYRSDGTYVPGYYRTNPDYTVRNNYSYIGNRNPFTGRTGTNYYRDNPSSGYYGTSPGRGILGFGSEDDILNW